MIYNIDDKRMNNLKIELEALNEAIRDGRKLDASQLVPCVLADVQRIIEEIEAQEKNEKAA